VLEDLPPTFEGATLVSVSKGNSRQIAAMLSHVTKEILDNDLDGDLVGAIVGLYDRLHPGPRPEFVG